MTTEVSTYETLRMDMDGRVAVITLNRPESGNALNSVMHRELADFWKRVKQDDDIWAVVLTGAGPRHFCTGADMREAASAYRQGGELERWTTRSNRSDDFGLPWQFEVTKPTICAINGTCAGGGLLFIWQSHITIAADNADFLEPHTAVGQLPFSEIYGLALGGLPWGIAMRMGLMGTRERMSVERAYELGLVSEAVPRDRLVDRAKEIANTVLEMSPLAVRSLIEGAHIIRSSGMGITDAFKVGGYLSSALRNTEDHREGPVAFAEKRRPNWKAR